MPAAGLAATAVAAPSMMASKPSVCHRGLVNQPCCCNAYCYSLLLWHLPIHRWHDCSNTATMTRSIIKASPVKIAIKKTGAKAAELREDARSVRTALPARDDNYVSVLGLLLFSSVYSTVVAPSSLSVEPPSLNCRLSFVTRTPYSVCSEIVPFSAPLGLIKFIVRYGSVMRNHNAVLRFSALGRVPRRTS